MCNSMGQNVPFFVFATTAPVYIADSNTANSEIATPSAVVNTAGSCGVTMAPSHTHNSFQLRSGTAGLQEAINSVKASGGTPAYIILDRNWWALANQLPGTKGLTIVGAATGGPGAILEDTTIVPALYYIWRGTSYSATTQAWTNAPPTATAGAAAGSGPTIANGNTSTQLSGTVSLTTGTSTTTGTIFTETFLTAAAGGFGYSTGGSCTVTQTSGPTVGFTSAIAGTTRVLTVTVSTPVLVDSTAYTFAYNCN